MGNGSDPTTIPSVASGSNAVMILLLVLAGALLASVGLRVFYRSMRKNATSVSKAVGGGMCTAAAVCYAIVLVLAGQTALSVLCLLVALGFAGYAIPAVRVSVRSKIAGLHAAAKAPKQPPDRVSHI